MDSYTILCTELRGSAQNLNGNIETLQKKADKLQKAINKVTRGDYKASDLSAAYTAQTTLTGSITRLGEICGAMNSAALLFSEASAELSGRADLTAYYMQHTDTLSYEGLMGTYSAAITSAGSAAAGYELVKDTLSHNGYSVNGLGSVSNAVQAAIQREADERAKQAGAAKWVLTGAVVVGGIVASLVTGGAAAPVVIGAISGAVMAGGNTAIDQYAEHGWDTDNWDYAEIGKDAFVGGVTGAATAWMGGKLTTGVTNFASNTQLGSTLLNNSNAVVRVGTGAVIGSASEVVSGVGSRGVGGFMSTIAETGDVGESFSAAVDYAFDGKEIAQDAVLGGVQGGKQQYKEWKTERATAPLDAKTEDPNLTKSTEGAKGDNVVEPSIRGSSEAMTGSQAQSSKGLETLTSKQKEILAKPVETRNPHETEVADSLRHLGYETQKSFTKDADGNIVEATYGKKGSHRPDEYRKNKQGHIDLREVKDYHNVDSLKRSMAKQAADRFEFFGEDAEVTFAIAANDFTVEEADRLQDYVENILHAHIDWITK